MPLWAARSTTSLMAATSAKLNTDSPTIFLVKTPRICVTSIETEALAPRTSRLAGAPVDISAAMAWAAK